MAYEVIGTCPVCSEALEVTELECPSCHTKIAGVFRLCKFCSLSEEHKAFAEVFIKNRGNIREVEKELGISYPTVRSRLESLIKALGYSVPVEPIKEDLGYAKQRKEILDRLSEGEITAEEATGLLKKMGSKSFLTRGE